MTEDVIELMPRQRPAAFQPGNGFPTAPRVLVADSEPLVCRIVTEAVASCGQLWVAGQTTTAAEIIGGADRDDLVIVDPFGFDADPVALVERVCARTMTVVWAHWQSPRDPVGCLRAGARGVLSKTGDLSGLPQAMLAVLAGHVVLDPSIIGELGSTRSGSPTTGAPHLMTCLTPTERAVFDLLEAGATTTTMSRQLQMTAPTVRSHISHVLQKLGLENRTQAAALGHALRQGFADRAVTSANVAPSL